MAQPPNLHVLRYSIFQETRQGKRPTRFCFINSFDVCIGLHHGLLALQFKSVLVLLGQHIHYEANHGTSTIRLDHWVSALLGK